MSKKKNVQIIDGARNALFDIFEIDENDFYQIFPSNGQDIEFSSDFIERAGDKGRSVLARLYDKRLNKKNVIGIHGSLFCGVDERKPFFKNKKWDEATAFADDETDS